MSAPTPPTGDHVLLLDPPDRPKWWTPWQCLCGVGGTGANEEAAQAQYRMHLAGLWPAFTEPVPGSEAFVFEGRTVWVKT